MAGQRLNRATLIGAGYGCAALVIILIVMRGLMSHRGAAPMALHSTRPMPQANPAPASATVGGYWKDPSFTPEQLERAYPSSSRPLSPKAMPQRSNITPPKAQATRLRRQIHQGEVTVQ